MRDKFFKYQGKLYPHVSGGRTITATVSIAAGVPNFPTRSIAWEVTFSQVGTGFDQDDITATPTSATVTVVRGTNQQGGPGNTFTVTLTLDSIYDTASFVIAERPSSGFIISTDLAGRTSDTVGLLTGTTVAIGAGVPDVATRSVVWSVRFGDAGDGLAPDDFAVLPVGAVVTIEGNAPLQRIRLTIPPALGDTGNAQFIINTDAFSNRRFTGAGADRRSDSVAYDFTGAPGTGVTPVRPALPPLTDVRYAIGDDPQIILGRTMDITAWFEDIQDIQHTLDDGDTYHFRIAEATLLMKNPSGEFSAYNDQNIFVQAGVSRYGFEAPVRILRGNQPLFIGKILEIYHNEVTADMRWVLSDDSLALNNTDVVDFGIPKRIRLQEGDRALASQHGEYPFPTAVAPPSLGSARAIGSAYRQQLYVQEHLQTEGELDQRNIAITDTELQTEGGYLNEGDLPIVAFKAPHRDIPIANLIAELLEHYEIETYDISVPPILREEAEYYTVGRPGYELEASETDVNNNLTNTDEWQWTGYVTDMQIDNVGPPYIRYIAGIDEHRGVLYGITGGRDLYSIDPITLRVRHFGNLSVQIENFGGCRGLVSLQNRLFVMARAGRRTRIYELFIDPDGFVTSARMQLKGHGVADADNALESDRGHPIALAARGDEMWIGYRQGMNYGLLEGNTIEVFSGLGYRDFDAVAVASVDNLEYIDGTFYAVRNADGAVISFDMPHGHTFADASNGQLRPSPLSGGPLGKYKGNLIGQDRVSRNLTYLNPRDMTTTRLDNPTIYFLYTARQSPTVPKLLQWQIKPNIWTQVYEHYEHAEFWRMATDDFDTFYIMGGRAAYIEGFPVRAAYNTLPHSGASPNTNTIWRYDRSSNVIDPIVDADAASDLRPQLAQYYHLGFAFTQNRHGFLPDTRKGFDLDLDDLYYIFANRDKVGVAKLTDGTGDPVEVFSARVDNWHNECGMDFGITAGTIHAAFTFIDEETGSSRLKYVTHSLGRPPRFARFIGSTALTENAAYDESVFASGDPVPTITSAVTDGSLPTGLTLDDARLHGTPTSIDPTGVRFQVTYTAMNERGSVPLILNYRVKDENAVAPTFAAFTMTSLTEGTPYDQSITATGTPTPTITATWTTLPTGMTVTGARLHGTPTDIPDAGSSFTVFWVATNSEGSVQSNIAFTVANTP